jgi:preprotein translocase subunit SecB
MGQQELMCQTCAEQEHESIYELKLIIDVNVVVDRQRQVQEANHVLGVFNLRKLSRWGKAAPPHSFH